jgi:hypothetical protein
MSYILNYLGCTCLVVFDPQINLYFNLFKHALFLFAYFRLPYSTSYLHLTFNKYFSMS